MIRLLLIIELIAPTCNSCHYQPRSNKWPLKKRGTNWDPWKGTIFDTQFYSQNGRERKTYGLVFESSYDKKSWSIKRRHHIYLHCLLVGKCRIILHFLLQEINCLLLFQSSTCGLNKVYHEELTGLKFNRMLMVNKEKMYRKSNWNS